MAAGHHFGSPIWAILDFCICPKFEAARKKLLPKNIWVKPSVYKFCELMNSKGKRTVAKMAKFAQIILRNFNNAM